MASRPSSGRTGRPHVARRPRGGRRAPASPGRRPSRRRLHRGRWLLGAPRRPSRRRPRRSSGMSRAAAASPSAPRPGGSPAARRRRGGGLAVRPSSAPPGDGLRRHRRGIPRPRATRCTRTARLAAALARAACVVRAIGQVRPGGPIAAILGEDANARRRAAPRERTGRDDPIPLRRGRRSAGAVSGDPVAGMLAARRPAMPRLTPHSDLLALAAGMPGLRPLAIPRSRLGILLAYRPRRGRDGRPHQGPFRSARRRWGARVRWPCRCWRSARRTSRSSCAGPEWPCSRPGPPTSSAPPTPGTWPSAASSGGTPCGAPSPRSSRSGACGSAPGSSGPS